VTPGKTRFNALTLVIAFLAVMLLQQWWVSTKAMPAIPYSEFQSLLKDGKVESLVVTSDEIQGELKEPQGNVKKRFRTTRVETDLANVLGASGVKFSGKLDDVLLPTILSWVMPMALFMGVWFLISRRMGGKMGPGGGLMSIGKSKAKVYVENDTQVSFADVAGVDEAKQELAETVQFLKHPAEFGRLGARMPKGILLVGPPGTGKTLLARAAAGEAGVPFFSLSGSDFVEMFVGVGAARVRDLFEQARQKAPCIIFIDELDALGRVRSSGQFSGGQDEKEQTLNQLLVEMDGFDPTSGIVLLAATNRPEILDPALLRAGRFDRQVLVDRPDRTGRIQILKVHASKVKLAEEVDFEQVAALTAGFTGADLANLVNEAALAATRRGGESITLSDFNVGIERIIAGLERKNRVLNAREREIVAHHEIGHALVAAAIAGSDPVHKISIIPRGIGALGYTIQRPTEDRFLMTREELENKMAVLMGGRCAEHVIYGHLSTGAADDLARATDIARNMVARYGMELDLGHVSFDGEQRSMLGTPTDPFRQRNYSEDTAREIDCAVRKLVAGAFARAEAILQANREILVGSAAELLTKETLETGDLTRLFAGVTPGPAKVEAPCSC